MCTIDGTQIPSPSSAVNSCCDRTPVSLSSLLLCAGPSVASRHRQVPFVRVTRNRPLMRGEETEFRLVETGIERRVTANYYHGASCEKLKKKKKYKKNGCFLHAVSLLTFFPAFLYHYSQVKSHTKKRSPTLPSTWAI